MYDDTDKRDAQVNGALCKLRHKLTLVRDTVKPKGVRYYAVHYYWKGDLI